jgi:hypothetical protein
MIDTDTNKPVRVLGDSISRAYIRVSLKHLEFVRKLLLDNQIRHWVDHLAISVDGSPPLIVVNLSKGTDPHQVQALLDQAA